MSIASTLPHSSPLAPLADIAKRAHLLTGGSGAAIALREGGHLVTVASSGDSAPDVGIEVNLDSSFAGLCFKSGATQVCNDTETDQRVNAAACRALQVRSMTATPIRQGETIRGVLAVFAPTAHAFNGNVAVLATLADIAGELMKRDAKPANDVPAVPAASKAKETAAPAAAEASTVTHLMSVFDPEPARPILNASSTGAVVPWPKEAPKQDMPKQENAARGEHSPEVLLTAEDPGPREFRRTTQTALPTFAMLDQMHKPLPQRVRRNRILMGVGLCMALLLVVGGWRWHAAKADATPVYAASSAEEDVQPTPSVPSIAAQQVQAEPAAAESPKPIEAKPAAPAKEKRAPAAQTSAPAERSDSDLPKRTELAIMIPTPLPKTEADAEEVTAPAAGGLATDRMPDLMSGKFSPHVPMAPASKVAPARLLKSVAPVYPEIARKSGYSDTVVVAAVVTKQGKLDKMRVVRGMMIFQGAAMDALKQWRYQPATLNGEPVESNIELQLRFRSNQ